MLRINGARLWNSLMELARIGATPKGGINRLTLTDLDRQSRDLVVARWVPGAGCFVVGVDRIGFVFARRPGTGRHAAAGPCWAAISIHSRPEANSTGRLRGHGGAGGGAHTERHSM